MDAHEQDIKKRIQQGESLTLEFKSDLKCLADRELVTAVVALANTEAAICSLAWRTMAPSPASTPIMPAWKVCRR